MQHTRPHTFVHHRETLNLSHFVSSPDSSPFCPAVDLDGCPNCDTVLVSLEAEQREASRLQKENKALVNGIFQLQTEVCFFSFSSSFFFCCFFFC